MNELTYKTIQNKFNIIPGLKDLWNRYKKKKVKYLSNVHGIVIGTVVGISICKETTYLILKVEPNDKYGGTLDLDVDWVLQSYKTKSGKYYCIRLREFYNNVTIIN